MHKSFIDDFLNEYKIKTTKNNFENYYFYFNIVKNHEDEIDKSFADFDINDCINVIFRGETPKFKTIKRHHSMLKEYLEYLQLINQINIYEYGDHPINYIALDNNKQYVSFIKNSNMLSGYENNFFYSEDQFVNWLEKVFSNHEKDGDKYTRFINYKMAIVFMWLGFSEYEIPEIHFNDYNFNKKEICKIKIYNKKLIEIIENYLYKVRPEIEKQSRIDTSKFILGFKAEFKHSTCVKVIREVNTLIKEKNISVPYISLDKINNSRLYIKTYEKNINDDVYLRTSLYVDYVDIFLKNKIKYDQLSSSTKSDIYSSYLLWTHIKNTQQ